MTQWTLPQGPAGLGRARLIGAMALIGAFALGCAGTWWVLRDQRTGLRVMVTATDDVPAELQRLALSRAQRVQVQEAIVRGRDRVLRVVDAFEPQMRTAMDSTDHEIRVLLSDAQRARLDSARALAGPALIRQRIVRP